jgi:hypothetical protein
MTFGVNALDWTNIGRKLQTSMAETVGESLTLPAESSVLSPFAYYDGATGTILTTYSAYLDTTSTPADVVTVKTDEDGGNVVVDVTPLTLLYNAVDADGNAIITSDASAEGVEVDDEGVAIPLPLDSSEYTDDLQTIFDTAIDTDTGWSPEYLMMVDGATDTGELKQLVDEVANSDSSVWRRVRARNGLESIYWNIPLDTISTTEEYDAFIEAIPTTFTFNDNVFFYSADTSLPLSRDPEPRPLSSAATVESTSVDSTRLSSTYESTLDDLRAAYEALLSPGGETDDGTSGDEDADTSVGFGEGITIWISDNLITPIKENRIYVAGGLVLVMSYVAYRRGWLTWLRGKKSKITWSPQISNRKTQAKSIDLIWRIT